METNNPAELYPYEMVNGLPRLSYSALKAFIQSPAHFIAYKEKQDAEVNAAYKFGKMFHCYLLQPDVYEKKYTLIPPDAPARPTEAQLNALYMSKDYCTLPDDAPKKPTDKQMGAAYMTSDKLSDKEKAKSNIDAKKWHDDFELKNEGKVKLTPADLEKRAELQKAIDWWADFAKTGKEILYPKELEQMVAMAAAIRNDEAALQILDNATEFEKELMFVDPGTGITMKVIIDIYSQRMKKASELKTTTSADPDIFKYEIKKFNYPGQGAIYMDALRANGLPCEEKRFQIIASEKKVPYGCSVNDISVHAVKKGRYDYQQELLNFLHWFQNGMPKQSYAYRSPLTGTFLYDIHESERV